jgi:hypothetical protein
MEELMNGRLCLILAAISMLFTGCMGGDCSGGDESCPQTAGFVMNSTDDSMSGSFMVGRTPENTTADEPAPSPSAPAAVTEDSVGGSSSPADPVANQINMLISVQINILGYIFPPTAATATAEPSFSDISGTETAAVDEMENDAWRAFPSITKSAIQDAVSLNQSGKYAEALAKLQTAISGTDNRNVWLRFAIATQYMILLKSGEAREEYATSCELHLRFVQEFSKHEQCQANEKTFISTNVQVISMVFVNQTTNITYVQQTVQNVSDQSKPEVERERELEEAMDKVNDTGDFLTSFALLRTAILGSPPDTPKWEEGQNNLTLRRLALEQYLLIFEKAAYDGNEVVKQFTEWNERYQSSNTPGIKLQLMPTSLTDIHSNIKSHYDLMLEKNMLAPELEAKMTRLLGMDN